MRKTRTQGIEQQDRGPTGGAAAGAHGPGRGYVDAREAAEMLGVSRRAVRGLAAKGRLEAKRDGEGAAARLVVCVASVERLRSEGNGQARARGRSPARTDEEKARAGGTGER